MVPTAAPARADLELVVGSSEQQQRTTTESNSRINTRTRRSHRKVRTGCVTCKIRRKKCDETRPSCLRCTSTGRTCDGYAAVSASATAVSTATSSSNNTDNAMIRPYPFFDNDIDIGVRSWSLGDYDRQCYRFPERYDHQINKSSGEETQGPAKRQKQMTVYNSGQQSMCTSIPQQVSQSLFSDQSHAHCFDFFRHHSAPQFGSYFGSSIWRDFLVRAALSSPVVLHAVTAVGAAHLRFNSGITPLGFHYCALSDALHKRSQRSLRQFQLESVSLDGKQSPYSAEIILATNVLHGVFETIQGNHEEAMGYMADGLKDLLNRPMKRIHCGQQYRPHPRFTPTLIPDLFEKLEVRATEIFGRKPQILVLETARSTADDINIDNDDDDGHLPPIPQVLPSLDRALDLLYTEIDLIKRTPLCRWQDDVARRQAQRSHVSRLLRWNAAFAEMLIITPAMTPDLRQKVLMLRIIRNAGHLLLYLVLYARTDHPDCFTAAALHSNVLSRTKNNPRDLRQSSELNISTDDQRDHESEETLILATHTLWALINTSTDLATNLTRICVLVDDILGHTSSSVDGSAAYSGIDHGLLVDTGIGPPRLAKPSPYSSSKTRHLIRSLLEPGVRESLMSGDGSLSGVGGMFSIAEQLSAIEEHAVYEAIKSSPVFRNINARWIEIGCWVEHRKVLVRYCRPARRTEDIQFAMQTGQALTNLGHLDQPESLQTNAGPDDQNDRGTIWAYEWLQF